MLKIRKNNLKILSSEVLRLECLLDSDSSTSEEVLLEYEELLIQFRSLYGDYEGVEELLNEFYLVFDRFFKEREMDLQIESLKAESLLLRGSLGL